MVQLYDSEEKDAEIIGDVEYISCLDYLQGTNFYNGGTGHHLGFAQLADGRYYLVFGTDWREEMDRAYIVSKDRIVKEIIKSEQLDVLDDYPELMELFESKYNKKTISSKTFSIRINLRESNDDTQKKIDGQIVKIHNYKNLE